MEMLPKVPRKHELDRNRKANGSLDVSDIQGAKPIGVYGRGGKRLVGQHVMDPAG